MKLDNSWVTLIHVFQTAFLEDTWKKLKPCDVLLVRSDLHCGYSYQGKAYSQLLDSFGDLCTELGLVTQSVAKPFSKHIGSRAHNSPVSYNRLGIIFALFRRFAWLTLGKIKGENWNYEFQARFWARILEKTKPSIVVGIQPGISICRAGKTKSIPIYDYQHGVIAKEHPDYGKEFNLNRPAKDLPDGFLCWDQQSAKELFQWAPQKGIDIRVVGNQWFSRFFLKEPQDYLVQKIVLKEKIFNNNRPTILVSLQWGMNKFYQNDWFNGFMVPALEEVILESSNNYNWLLRLHPVQIHGAENKKINYYLKQTFGHLSFVEWSVCSTLPLPAVLKQIDLHITDMSTIIVEASWMGLRSGILSTHIRPNGIFENYFSNEISNGVAEILPQNPEVIMDWIYNTLIKDKIIVATKSANENMKSFILETTGIKEKT